MKKNLSIILFAFGLIGFTSAIAQKEITKTFTGVKRIKMTTAAGGCKIQRSKDASVVVYMKHDYDENAEYNPKMTMEGDRLVIKEEFASGNRNFNGSSSWTLSVPDDLRIDFTTGSGDVNVETIKANLKATSGSGDLTFNSVTGDVDGTTGSGNVELENYNGEIKATTGSGDMRVNKGQGDITLTCGSGDIRVDDSKAAIMATTGSGSIDGKNVNLTGSSKFTTGSGRATIVLAATPKFDISVTSGSGDAEVNFNGNEIVGEIVMKANKRNGTITAPFTFDSTEEENNGGNSTTIVKTVVKGGGKNRINITTGSGDAVIKSK